MRPSKVEETKALTSLQMEDKNRFVVGLGFSLRYYIVQIAAKSGKGA